MKKLVHAVCPHDCPDACGVLITIENGPDGSPARATRIQGDPDHPVTRGFLCAKVAKYLDRVYSPHRVLYPLRRTARKGPAAIASGDQRNDFKRISWEEALTEIATRFRRIADESGPEAILPYSYGGTLGVLGGGSMDRRFFHRLGASQLDRTICSEAGSEGLKSVLGIRYGTEPEQFAQARTIIAWGANIHGNNIHLWPFIEEARQKGAKLIVIDPYRTRTAACADWYIPINPGTDVALALAMMHVIVGEKLHDEQYVLNYTFGFEQLRERVREYPPEKVAQWTGIPADDIRTLAREYATARPSVIRVNYGLQRCDNGGMAVRAIGMLPCLTGSWKEVGGGLQLSLSAAFQLNRPALEVPGLMMKSSLGRPSRVINMVELGKALNEIDDPPVKALFVYNSNPAAVAPDHNNVVRGFKREDLFTVVHEQFLTDTCDYADIVLPATTFFEHKDLQNSYGHHYLGISQQALEPQGECMSNVDLFRTLAERMGFEDDCFRESVDDMIESALASGHQHLKGITRERLEHEPFVRLNLAGGTETSDGHKQQQAEKAENDGGTKPFLPFAHGGFATASGKAEFYSDTLAAMGLDPLVSFTPPVESRHVARGKYPLELLPRKADNYTNSTFANLERHQRFELVRDFATERAECSDARARRVEDPALHEQGPVLHEPARNGRLLTTDILEINSADSNIRGIRNGDTVRVFNDRGEIRLVAQVSSSDGSPSVQPGVVAARLNWAKLTPGGRNINVLTSDRLTDMGRGATFYSVLVEVEKIG